MLYGNTSISTYTRGNVIVWMLMALQGGILNIGGFFACHRFVSHVTGFATLFGGEASRLHYAEAAGMLIVPMLFLVGAMMSAALVDVRLKTGRNPRYYVLFGVMFLLIMTIVIGGHNGLFGAFGEPAAGLRDYVLLALLCLICGLQNGSVTTVSNAVIRTTHLTGITTDLGIGLMRILYRKALPDEYEASVRANRMRIGIIFFFIAGSVLGGFTFRNYTFDGFLLPAAISGGLFLTTFYFQFLARFEV